MTIVMSIGSVAGPVTAAAQAAGAASIFFSIIDAPQPQTGGLSSPAVSSQGDIVVENVTFAYPVRHDVKVIENLSLRFPAGKITAIVGASGSGKSTIVGLLERWYELDGNMTDNILVSSFQNSDALETVSDRGWRRSSFVMVQSQLVVEAFMRLI
jgi:ABC-type multidrug transport system fused ATPase/permease subunit